MNQYLRNFQEGFSKERKTAILVSLMSIARSDKEINPTELEYIKKTGVLLGIEFDFPVFQQMPNLHEDSIINALKSLNKLQKEWYALTTHGLIISDNVANHEVGDYDIETCKALEICQKIGISENEYLQIIKKALTNMKI
jgi:hypothetical protein